MSPSSVSKPGSIHTYAKLPRMDLSQEVSGKQADSARSASSAVSAESWYSTGFDAANTSLLPSTETPGQYTRAVGEEGAV
jgi:hypothetical protein